MVDVPQLPSFVLAASILTITPGVDTAMVLRAVAAEGPRAAMMAAVGIGLGCMAWGCAASFGLGALLHASEIAYTVVRWTGAAYLALIGLKLLMRPQTVSASGSPGLNSRHRRDAFWRGFLTNLLNPKVGVFYITFLPQFFPAGTDVTDYSLFLTGLHVALTLLWFGLLITAAAPLGAFLRRPRAVSMLNRLTGCIFVGFGVKLAISAE